MNNLVLDQSLILTLTDSLKNAFLIQARLDMDVLEIKNGTVPGISLPISTQIDFSDIHFNGKIRFFYTKKFLTGLFEKMSGETTVISSEDVISAGLEMMNIYYTSARREINKKGFNFNPAFPRIVKYSSIMVQDQWSDSVTIICRSPIGNLLTEVSITKLSAA